VSEAGGLERLLHTDDADPGCEAAIARLHVFVDITAVGGDAAAALPGVAVHLATGPACAQDFQGLRAAVGCDPS
jgi:hypothetical protein